MGSSKISQLIQHNYFNDIQQLFIPLWDPHWESNKMWAVLEDVPVCGVDKDGGNKLKEKEIPRRTKCAKPQSSQNSALHCGRKMLNN